MQIKRAEATITHLESEPAACPYCMETDFGVIYEVQRVSHRIGVLEGKVRWLEADDRMLDTMLGRTP